MIRWDVCNTMCPLFYTVEAMQVEPSATCTGCALAFDLSHVHVPHKHTVVRGWLLIKGFVAHTGWAVPRTMLEAMERARARSAEN